MASYLPEYGSQSQFGILNDLLGSQPIARRGDSQAYIEQLLEDLRSGQIPREGITNEVDMGPDPYQGNPYSDEEYQIAGDVVPMRSHPPAISDVQMRLKSPGVGARSQGMQSIERFKGDPRSIDLLGVLEMMTGREPGR